MPASAVPQSAVLASQAPEVISVQVSVPFTVSQEVTVVVTVVPVLVAKKKSIQILATNASLGPPLIARKRGALALKYVTIF